ncbi:MAG: hypothetical protein H7A25_26105 [Leptospiraceae bacterium]|nr:hypothetical protein [Leptospiraceae bacterium]
MIKEIIEFTKDIENELNDSDIQLNPGYHAIIDLDEYGNIKGNGFFSYTHRKGELIDDEYLQQLNELAKIEKISKALGNNKGIIDKKIFSNNIYTLYFKLIFSNEKEKLKILKDFISNNKANTSITLFDLKIVKNNFDAIFSEKIKDNHTIRIKEYYSKIKTELYNDEIINKFDAIESFCLNKLKKILLEDENFSKGLILKKNKKGESELSPDLLDSEIRINFSSNYDLVKEASDLYFNQKLPLKDDKTKNQHYTKIIENTKYFLPSFYYQDNDKKPFLKHKTSAFLFNTRLPLEDLKSLFTFEEYLKDKLLPNPLPIFIDKRELNKDVITLIKRDGKVKYSEIIKNIYEDKKEDLGNYYLLYTMGKEIKDFDFVSNFRYKTDFEIKNLFKLKNNDKTLPDISIDNIFLFERVVIDQIFNGGLIRYFDDNIRVNYFTMDDPKSFKKLKKDCGESPIIYQLVLKYRKAIFDYIYKSKTEAINGNMFYDILISGIMNDIKKDHDWKHSYKIKEKLNIWFSLNHHFDKNNINFGGHYMPSRLQEQLDRIKSIASENSKHLETDDEFAFASGQLIFHLLTKSQSATRTHALLEPFLQKHDIKLYKEAIAKTFERYKHEFTLYPNKYEFDRIMSEVMAFELEEKNLKKLLPFILAGYFSESVFKKEKSTGQGDNHDR